MRISKVVAGSIFLLLSLFAALPVAAQVSGLPLTPLQLDDLEAFRSPADHWQIVGGVYADRNVEHALSVEPGQGILVSIPTEGQKTNLFTEWKHEGIELELDFMMPKGSDAGIYLQGRYEVQLSDSWGASEDPSFAACGGIYRRWDPTRPEGQRGYQGHPPRMNVVRAPGLWQHLRVVFEAPEFNEAGEKVEDARFVEVVLNGVVIHKDVAVTGPTQGAPFQDEQPTGPLVIQGSQGPIAIRNIEYKRYGDERVTLKELHYAYYEGEFSGPSVIGENPKVWIGPYKQIYYEAEFEGIPDTLAVKSEGRARALTQELAKRPDDFALKFSGVMQIPTSGTYLFKPEAAGAARLMVDGTVVADSDEEGGGQIELEAGAHPFTFIYTKSQRGEPVLGLYAEGPGIARHELTAPGSMPSRFHLDPILVRPKERPIPLRGFAYPGGEMKTHAIFVGHPEGIHYSYDLSRGALLELWKGRFVNAAFIWRGRARARGSKYRHAQPHPLGSVITLSGRPSVAFLEDEQAPWPDSLRPEAGYRFEGYTLEEEGGLSFTYRLGDVEVTDHIAPAADARMLTRELTFRGRAEDLWVHLAEADHIEELPDGTYSVGDFMYYIDVQETSGASPRIREVDGHEELLLPVQLADDQATVSYSIIW